jgi:hypothetical protein
VLQFGSDRSGNLDSMIEFEMPASGWPWLWACGYLAMRTAGEAAGPWHTSCLEFSRSRRLRRFLLLFFSTVYGLRLEGFSRAEGTAVLFSLSISSCLKSIYHGDRGIILYAPFTDDFRNC